jgi:hypothetical protein
MPLGYPTSWAIPPKNFRQPADVPLNFLPMIAIFRPR